jgi:hypothetical protein
MGATYTRQSASAIVDGAVIEASDINAEFDQVLAAFAVTSGHTHDGTAAEGGPITKLLGTALTIGNGTAGTDIAVTFDGETADGVLTWMEDEDYFKFSDDILMNSTERLNFGDTGTYIFQSTDGQLDIVADTEVQIAATTIDINGAVALNGAITGATNITLSGELDAATLDISGDADIDGTLEADAITINGVTLAETISDTVGAMVTSNTESGITVAYDDADNTLDFTVGTLNQNTTGNAATATALETARTIGGTSFDGTANIAVALSDTATALATARTIGGTSFDGTANIAVALSATATALATARTIHGVSFDGTANIDLSEVISDTVGAMVTSNTESGITVAYDDADNTLDFTVGTLNQSTTGNAATATALETARTIGGTSFDGTANIAVNLAATATALATARTIAGQSFDGSANITIASTDLSNTSNITLNDGTQTLTNKTLTSPKINEDVAVTSTATELNLLDGSTAGTIANSKAVIYSAAGQVNGTTLAIAGTAITSTATELNLLDGVSGLVQADFTKLAAIDSTAAELNYSDLTTLGTTAASKVFTADANNLTTVSGAVANVEDTLTDGATITWDVIDSPVAKVTLAGNRTLSAPSGTTPIAGQFVSLLIIQDGTGSRTITWNAVYEFAADTAPTLTATASLGDLFTFRYNGAKWLEVGRNLALTLS